MKLLSSIRTVLAFLFRRPRIEREMEEELRSHLQSRADDLERQGLSRAEAERQARVEFGGYQRYREECREALGTRWLGELMADLRYGVRQLRRSPGFTVIAVMTIALGISAATAIFSVVNGVLLKPLPYPNPDRLVAIAEKLPPFSEFAISYPDFLDWVKMNHTFAALAAYRHTDMNLTGSSEAERLKVTQVSASFFPLLGVKPVIGRNFSSGEDRRGSTPVVILSGGFWKSKFGGSPGILGKVVTLDGKGHTVVGVIPQNFYFCCESENFVLGDVYVPIGSYENQWMSDRGAHPGIFAVGRLKAGVTLQQARADVDGIARDLASAYPDSNKNEGIALIPLKERMVGEVEPVLLMLLAAVGFVLLIACANVANLLLARATGRTREFIMRAALDASRGRLIRQLLTESILLALAGGGLGLMLASWGTKAALGVLPKALPHADDVRLDPRVLAFTLIASIFVGVLFGLAPALQSSRPDWHESLKESGRGSSGAGRRMQHVVVALELAMAVVLLAGAGLTIRSLALLWRVNPGFNPQNVLTFNVALPPSTAKEKPDQIRASVRHLTDAIAAVPGVKAVAITDGAFPMQGGNIVGFWAEGHPKPATQSEMPNAVNYIVGTGYFKVMRIPLLNGRLFRADDDLHSRFVAVIDEDFARSYFRNQDAVGKHVHLAGPDEAFEIVGVVGHVNQGGLDEDPRWPLSVQIYVPVSQIPDQFISLLAKAEGFVVRTQSPHYASTEAIRTAIDGTNREQVAYGFESMDGIIATSLSSRTFAVILLAVFAGLALALASIGIYGVISYSVAQRTHEIGIRMALGAQKSDVLRMVVGQGFKLTLIGVAAGIVGALALTRFLSSLLYGVKPTDLLTFVAVSLLLTGVALLACYIPARRATQVDPMVALRHE
ncbi:MAG: ADOP family duplicated permease [Terriglobia bacterium]